MAVTMEHSLARNDVQQKLDAGIVMRAKVIAVKRGIHLAEYLSELLRPLVDRDYEEEMRKEGFVKAEKREPKRPKAEEEGSS